MDGYNICYWVNVSLFFDLVNYLNDLNLNIHLNQSHRRSSMGKQSCCYKNSCVKLKLFTYR